MLCSNLVNLSDMIVCGGVCDGVAVFINVAAVGYIVVFHFPCLRIVNFFKCFLNEIFFKRMFFQTSEVTICGGIVFPELPWIVKLQVLVPQ